MEELADILRKGTRIALVPAMGAALVALMIGLMNGRAGNELYLCAYAFMYGWAPAAVALVAIAGCRAIARKPVWAFIRTEVLLGLLTLLVIFLPLLILKP